MENVTSPDGTQIAYRGGGSGEDVLFVHGSIDSSSEWSAVARRLRDRFTTVTMDRRGRGRSGFGTEPYSIEREADDIAAVLAATGARKVVAHSYGGLCAMVALDRGSPIQQLVLYEPPVSVPPDAAEQHPELALDLRAGRHDPAVASFLTLAGATDADVALIRDSPGWPALVAAVPSLPRELSAVREWRTPQGPFDIPALLLIGAETTSPSYLAGVPGIEAAFPRLRRQEIAGQTHLAHVLAPDALAAAIDDFLGTGSDRVSRAGSPL